MIILIKIEKILISLKYT